MSTPKTTGWQPGDEIPEGVLDAVAAAIGDAYDCIRHWGARSYGTMGPDDFSLVADDGDRVAEIAGAALEAAHAVLAAPPEPYRWQPIETAPKDGAAVLVMRNNWPGCPNGVAEECNEHNTYVAAWWDGEGAWVCYMDQIIDPVCPVEPTHWMPLPPAPGSAPPEQAAQPADDHETFEAVAKSDTSGVSFERDEHGYVDMTAALLWRGWQYRSAAGAAVPQSGQPADVAPIDMVLHCPACGVQHIDRDEAADCDGEVVHSFGWDNPPHRSHLCHGCGYIWRPADVPTNGVATVKTKGKADSPILSPADVARLVDAPLGFIKPDNDRQVFFYEQDFYVLSNFSAFALQWSGLRFDTSEAAYQWEKFKGTDCDDIRARIRLAPSAHEAFKIAEANRHLRRHDWDAVKIDVMREILRAKVDQHEYVRRKLLATGDRELIEDSWRDDFWGWGPNRDGQNVLGKLWMEVRAELRAALAAKGGA